MPKKFRCARRAAEIEYAIRDVVVPASKLEAQGHKILKLNIGDPNAYDFDTPLHIKNACIDAITAGKNGYAPSSGVPELLDTIARKEKNNDVELQKENIVIGNGVSGCILMLFAAMLEKNDEILVPGPTYPIYNTYAKFYDAVPVEYRTNEEDGWQPDIDDMRKKINSKTKAVVVINPNNPTGALYSKKTIKKIVDLAGEYELPVIADMIYEQLVFEEKCTNPATLSNDVPVIILNGISKVYLAPGWRIGYVAFRDDEHVLDEIKDGVMRFSRSELCSNTPCQYGYLSALDGSQEHIKKTVKELKERRDFAVKRINEIDGLSTQKPGGAFYMFPKINTNDDKKWAVELLHKKHVLVVHGSGFSEEYGKGHFRMVFLPPLNILEEALNRVEEFMKGK